MDNGIEIPVNDMSVQENSQKLANDLNLALDMGYERGAADSGLWTIRHSYYRKVSYRQ